MDTALKQFKKNIESITTIDGIYQYFSNQVHALDLSEILRSQFVLLVSAFDHYVHEVVRDGVLRIFDGEIKGNGDYEKFQISLKCVNLIVTADPTLRRQLLDNEIRRITSKHSYQSPTNVDRALSLISVSDIWKKIAKETGKPKEDLVKELGLIVHRRNKIAHEADIDPVSGSKTIIDRQTIIDTKDFLVRMVESIEKSLVHRSNVKKVATV